MNKNDMKIVRALNRKRSLESGDYWQNRSRQVPNKKKQADKDACKKNRRFDDANFLAKSFGHRD